MIYDDDVIFIISMMMILSSNGSLVVNISSASVDERLGDRDREFKTLAKYVRLKISSITERPFEGEGLNIEKYVESSCEIFIYI